MHRALLPARGQEEFGVAVKSSQKSTRSEVHQEGGSEMPTVKWRRKSSCELERREMDSLLLRISLNRSYSRRTSGL